MGISTYMAIGMGVLIITFGVYFKYTQSTIANLNQEVAVQTTKAAIAEANNKAIREQVANQAKALTALATVTATIQKESLRVSDIFGDHNLALLASKKPALIESRVNKGTAAVLEEIESL